jgi:hypothetical protein
MVSYSALHIVPEKWFRASEFVHICSSQTVTLSRWPAPHASCILQSIMPATTSTELREQIVQWFYNFNLPVYEIVLLSGHSQTTVYQILHLRVVRAATAARGEGESISALASGSSSSSSSSSGSSTIRGRAAVRNRGRALRGVGGTLRQLRVTLSNKSATKEALERDELLPAVWMAEIGGFHEDQFIFLDEAGVGDHMGERRRGWSSVG